MGEWWSVDDNDIIIYTEELDSVNNYSTPQTIYYKRKGRKGAKFPAVAVSYRVKMGSKEQKQMFKDFGIKLKDKWRD